MLLHQFLLITAGWRSAFHQQRSFQRALCQAFGLLATFGRRTLSRTLCALGHQFQDWSADYRLHSRAPWQAEDLFQPIVENALPFCRTRFISVAVDDTRIHKSGRRILSAFFQRDPLSPKFRFNLMFGLRFLQCSLLVPLYQLQKQAARGLPVRFEEVPALKKPRKKALEPEWVAWRAESKRRNLSTRTVAVLGSLRNSLDMAGAKAKTLLAVCDNSFCNRTLFRAELDRTDLIARARRDIKLCHRAAEGSTRFYDPQKFTPEQVRQDPRIPWKKARIFLGGEWRKIRYKEVTDVYWESAACRRPLRLFVVAPIPYKVPGRKKYHYRDPAFLLTTELRSSARLMLQPYFDRWQIEVNHREEKDTLGVGQAQVRSAQSVPRQPAFAVAAYSALLLSGLLAFGPERGNGYEPLPKWRRNAKRPSLQDLLAVLRKDLNENQALLRSMGIDLSWESLGLSAAA